MQYIQAKRLDNKLGMRDNRPFIIDKVAFVNDGFLLILEDDVGNRHALGYNNLDWFMKDFDIRNCRSELEGYKRLDEFNNMD